MLEAFLAKDAAPQCTLRAGFFFFFFFFLERAGLNLGILFLG